MPKSHRTKMKDADRTNNEKPKPEPITTGFKKLGLQWLIEHITSHQHLWEIEILYSEIPNCLNPQTLTGKCRTTDTH